MCLRTILMAGLLCSATFGLGPGVLAADWPGFLGQAQNGRSSEKGLNWDWPAQGPQVLWHRQVGVGYGACSTAGGKVFVYGRYGDEAVLECLDALTGEPVWRFAHPTDFQDMLGYNNGPRCCPVIHEGFVYLYGAEGWLHCLSVEKGAVIWKVDTMRQFNVSKNFFGVGSTPVIEGNLLIVQVGGSPAGSPPDIYSARGNLKGNGSGIVAFDRRTGRVVYQITDELASYASPVLATIGGRRWAFMFARGGLVGFEPATGQVDFHYPWRSSKLESVNASNPVVAGDRVFISETYGPGSSLLKAKPGGYELIWKDEGEGRPVLQTHWNTPIHLDGHIYACSGRNPGNAELRCLELETGKVKWSQLVRERSSLIYADGHLIGLGEFGRLMLIRPDPQKLDVVAMVQELKDEKGQVLLTDPCWSAPVLSNGLLYLRGRDPHAPRTEPERTRLVCLDLRRR